MNYEVYKLVKAGQGSGDFSFGKVLDSLITNEKGYSEAVRLNRLGMYWCKQSAWEYPTEIARESESFRDGYDQQQRGDCSNDTNYEDVDFSEDSFNLSYEDIREGW
tara:strand:+ start:177 stop:494 length:318 start_codon:yes stop_codon:yes gene_type:complete